MLNNDEHIYGKFLFDVNQYSTQSILKHKREEEKKIVVVDHRIEIRSDDGDNRHEKRFKHNEM